jgi:hypothetical protein
MSDGWEEVNVPRGAYVGWGDRPGQSITGEVLDYSDDGGTDFDGRSCPQVSIILTEQGHSHSKQDGWSSFNAGELVVINCGQASLKRAVQTARLRPGDLCKITMQGIENIKGGKTVKVFGIKVKRGSGQSSQQVAGKPGPEPSFGGGGTNGGDPWAAQSSASAPAGGFGGADDEPPF